MRKVAFALLPVIVAAMAISVLFPAVGALAALSYPNRPIQIVVPASAGGGTDQNGRIVAKYLKDYIGVPVVVTNISGNATILGLERVIDSAPDGYTVFFCHTETLVPKIAGVADVDVFDLRFAGASMIQNQTVLCTHKNYPYKTLAEIIEYAKAHPGEVEFPIATGGYAHLIGAAIEQLFEVDLNLVDIGGDAEKNAALLSGKTDFMNTQYGLTLDFFKNGDFINLGLLSDKRNDLMSDVPAAGELGFPMNFGRFYYCAVPKDTPDEVVETFAAALKKVSDNPEYIKECEALFINPVFMTPAECYDFAQNQREYLSQFSSALRK
jgi:tripartite-type tricarboxylate transporter receptor subunit TctC